MPPANVPPSRALAARPAQPAGAAPLAPRPPEADHALPPRLEGAAREAYAAAWSKETLRAYRRAWAAFADWCVREGRQALPAAPATVVAYLLDMAPAGGLTRVEHAKAAIAWMHEGRGFDPPPTAAREVKTVMQGIRRQKGVAPQAQKRPVTLSELHEMVACIDRTRVDGMRDAAVLLVGFAGAFRRSELVAIDVEHVRSADDGLAIYMPRSKTDQEGEGYTKGLKQWDAEPAVCPVRALRDYVQACGIRTGPVFRGFTRRGDTLYLRDGRLSANVVARIVKRYATAAGLPAEPFGGHSLRAGLVTEAYRQNVPEAQIMQQTGHKSASMLARYRREVNPVKRGATSAIDPTKGRK